MTSDHHKPKLSNWIPLVVTIVAYDSWLMVTGRSSLSSSFRTTSRDHPILLTLGVSYLLGHLYGLLPGQSDALSQLAEALASRGEVLDA